MKHIFVRLSLGTGALALFTLTGGIAAAQPPAGNALAAPAEDVGAPPTVPPGTYPAGKSSTADQGTEAKDADNKAKEDFHPFAIEANPLSAAIGRYSIQAEYLPMRHHALVLNPHFDHVNASVTSTVNGVKTSYSEGFTGGGAELGYRFYTGDHGANGFYIGPSFLFGAYSTSLGDQKSSFTTLGGAIDLGGQALIAKHVVLGGGFGLQYTKASKDFGNSDLPLTAAILAGGGIRPRFLLSVGYAP